MIVHAGDFTKSGTLSEALDFLQWFSHLNFKYKIFIAGPHDLLFDRDPGLVKQIIPSNVIYLEESGIEVGGLKIWGSPYNLHHGGAFSKTSSEIQHHWDKIPEGTNLVIVHNPPYGVLDKNAIGEHEGCKKLLRRLIRIEPTYFVCGHQRGDSTYEYHYGIHFINASLTNADFKITNKPVFKWYP